VQCSRQEVVDLLRKAGFREAADEAMVELPDPVDLEHVQEDGGYGAELPGMSLSARWAVALREGIGPRADRVVSADDRCRSRWRFVGRPARRR
jgi:hypothetical protein